MPATSLASRFLVTLLVSTVLPFLVFGWFAVRGMRKLIDDQVVAVLLPQLAVDHAQRIEARLQQIFQACSVVREIARATLQKAALQNDAGRAFEEQIELVPDLLDNYLDLVLLADGQGQLKSRAYGHFLDPTTAGSRLALVPENVADTEWFRRAQQQVGAFWLPLGRSPYMHRGLEFRSLDPADYHLGLVIDVPQPKGPPGVLLALIRWPEVQQLLDAARKVLIDNAHFPTAEVFLVDPAGTIQAHTNRAAYGQQLEPAALRTAILGSGGDVGRTEFVDASGRPCLAGFARLGTDQNRRWMLGLSMPATELFATSDAFERVLVLAIAVTVLILVIWSLVASRAIVQPVRRLVSASARIAQGDLSVRVPVSGGHELGELGAAFNQMAAELATGRERLKNVERQAAWAEMARQVAHEIKNPLTPMRMAAQLLMRARREGDARAQEIAERLARTVLEQTEALDKIASDFRHFAGAPVRQVETMPVDDLLAEVRKEETALFQGGGLQLELDPGAPGVHVAVDRGELSRVFVNLLQNAVQAAPQGVRVKLSSRREDGLAVVRVTDDGPGVPVASRSRLFEPYFTTKSAGTGLGLAICRRIVEAHNGAIWLESSVPGNTVFRIELPVAG